MGNYHDDLRAAAQDVVDAKAALRIIRMKESPTQAEETAAVYHIYDTIDRLKKQLESDEHYS